MLTYVRSSRWAQIAAWAIAILFVLGFFVSPVGAWTGAILGVWFVTSQRPGRGFVWMVGFSLVFSLQTISRTFAATILAHGPARTLQFLGLVSLAVLLNVLPFTFHRLIGPRLPGFVSTLPFPLAAVALPALVRALHVGPDSGNYTMTFFTCWFAAVAVWMWRHEFRAAKIAVGVGIFVAVCALAAGLKLYLRFSGTTLSPTWASDAMIGQVCLGGSLLLGIWALFPMRKGRTWRERAATLARLQSPFTGEPLHLVSEEGREALVSDSGERFPIRNGVQAFLKPEDLSGDNGKYNHVYETIGGFYDDIQRISCALKGFDRDLYFRSYMQRLEVKPGDSVLETSVGTGLNYKYLPLGVRLSGLDLSPEMLVNCEANLRRWGLDADLYLGNAESLPFADSSFDVVFHVGGINFFNDRAKAIREMIRVAKPGSLLLISDETEKHVKEIYEKQPGSLYKNRKEPVSAPIDLVPPEMQEIHLEELRGGDTYALTFRKPALEECETAREAASLPCVTAGVSG